MEKIRNFYEKYKIIDVILIILIIFVFSFLYCRHLNFVLSDRGREFLLPQVILEGQIPYKDITLIYFPFSYYINALIYKILGISMNSFIISQTFVCTVFMVLYYYLSREFLNRFYSLLLSLLVISSCIFSTYDIFSFAIPYSYARVYGLLGYVICIFALIKLHKTDNIKYVYLASIAAGFSICCKLEFLSVVLLLIIGILLYKKIKVIQYLKIILLFLIFPLIALSIMFFNGITLNDITDSINFATKFAKTESMTYHLIREGMYPAAFFVNFKEFFHSCQFLISVLFFTFIILKFYQKYKSWIYSLIIYALVLYGGFSIKSAEGAWLFLPLTIMIALFLLFKRVKNDLPLLLLLICALFISQREFFALSLLSYGTYSFPLLVLGGVVLINKFAPKEVFGLGLKNILYIFIIFLIGFYSFGTLAGKVEATNLISSSKGNIYVKPNIKSLVVNVINYIENNIDKNATVLVLPEGNIINFLTDRKEDMHCFMMDRLYHDAYGEEQAKNLIAKTNSDYIILFRTIDLNNFNKPYLYSQNETLSSRYIFNNYKEVQVYKSFDDIVTILKRK